MTAERLQSTARALVAPGKGLLAADESLPTIEKRFATIGVRSTEDTRSAYREMLFSTHGINEFISGVILFDETLRRRASNGTSFVEVLKNQNIIPGIKVDKGAKRLAGFPNERITEGLDGLRERLAEYAELGARFTKWRAVIKIGHDFPTLAAMKANAHALARFAALSQEAGLVPIVEPEVLMDGDHTLDRHREISETMIKLTFEALSDFRVQLEGMLLKPNMVLPGTESNDRATIARVAEETVHCLLRSVPPAVPGIVFLSGGQSDVLATEHLNAINELDRAPWQLSFSFGRALQDATMKTWRGLSENIEAAQHAFYHRARCNSAARYSHYTEEMEHNVRLQQVAL
jgi:fructose-bisphosphate aldolase, class I